MYAGTGIDVETHCDYSDAVLISEKQLCSNLQVLISTVTKQIILIKNRAKFFIRFKYISLSLKLVNYTQSPQVDELERCKIKD